MREILTHPILRGALSGALAAAAVDFAAFRQWQSFREFTTYQWGVAMFRWVQGAAIGAVTAAGVGAL